MDERQFTFSTGQSYTAQQFIDTVHDIAEHHAVNLHAAPVVIEEISRLVPRGSDQNMLKENLSTIGRCVSDIIVLILESYPKTMENSYQLQLGKQLLQAIDPEAYKDLVKRVDLDAPAYGRMHPATAMKSITAARAIIDNARSGVKTLPDSYRIEDYEYLRRPMGKPGRGIKS